MRTFKLDNVIRVTDDPYQIENYLADGYVEVAPEPVVEPVFPTFGTETTVG